jgi:hypothetical protein
MQHVYSTDRIVFCLCPPHKFARPQHLLLSTEGETWLRYADLYREQSTKPIVVMHNNLVQNIYRYSIIIIIIIIAIVVVVEICFSEELVK